MKRHERRIRRWSKRLSRIAARLLPVPLLAAGAAFAAPPVPDRITLLVPDTADLNSWEVKVWVDSAAEAGLNVRVIRDKEFLQLSGIDPITGATIPGSRNNAPTTIGALIMPDSAHIEASDAVVNAVKAFANLGGKLMLVYDAGALKPGPFYEPTKSRFSDLVGVDYVLYDTLLDKVAGFGQVVGTTARLERLGLPPGKYLPYTPPASLTTTTYTTAFVPSSNLDPGGTKAMRPAIEERARMGIDEASRNVRAKRGDYYRRLIGLDVEPSGPLRFGSRYHGASRAIDWHWGDYAPRSTDWVKGVVSADLRTTQELTVQPFSSTDATLQAISGYAYGPLSYFSFVTAGDITQKGGKAFLSSPEHGLVAGARPVGSGEVLFVNMPLGYHKAIGTDSAPLQGFLTMFARDHVGMPVLSTVPKGRGGLVYNWHVDDRDDLTVDMRALIESALSTSWYGGDDDDDDDDDDNWGSSSSRLLNNGPFSIHFTAGPDVIKPGDGLGMNLAGNRTSQYWIRKLASLGARHELGSHGGWIHDYWGLNASESNESTFLPLLVQNFAAIEGVTGRRIREYSSPQGNNPLWALNWLENRGVVAFYDVGNGGAPPVRPWRAGQRITNKMWSIPVSPNQRYATFEEFSDPALGNFTEQQSAQWLIDLQSFVVNMRTVRMFYNHPPGARDSILAVRAMVDRARSLQQKSRFNWYTMTQVADFSQRRLATTWSKSTSRYYYKTYANFTASNPTSLADVTWLLPRTRFEQPRVQSGYATVSYDSLNWVVTATYGTSLRFTAAER
jgi:hypothetical protein